MSIELLETAAANFLSLLDTVDDSKWGTATACEGWDVTALVDHIVGGAAMSAHVIRGGSTEEAIRIMSAATPESASEKKIAAAKYTADHIDAFRELTNLDAVVHHPAMDMPAGQLLGFRIGDYLLHTWDLASGLGQDVELDAAGVAFMWEILQPMAPMLGSTGRFGEGASGNVPETAPLQTRLLDLTGRRP